MSDDELRKWQSRAMYVATKAGFKELAEDFASEMFVHFLTHPNRGATVDQLFIDFLRKERGDIRTRKGKIRAEARTLSLDEKSENGYSLSETLASPEAISEYEPIYAPQLKSSRLWFIYKCVFIDDMKQSDVAALLDITEGAITFSVWLIKKSIEKRAILAKGREHMERDASFLVFHVNWLTI